MLNIKRTSQASVDRFIKALVCGSPGSGKTLVSSTFPDPLYITTEGLMMSVADRDVPYHFLKSQDELLTAVRMLQQSPKVRAQQFGFPVNTVVIDTIDGLSIMLLKERMRVEKHSQATLQDYGWLRDQMIEIVTALRGLEMNVVLTCHLKSREVGGISSFLPAVEGGFSEMIAGYVDIACVLQSRLVTRLVGNDTERVVERYIQTIPDLQHQFIKDHSGKLPPEVPLNFVDDYERIATIIYGPVEDRPDPVEDDSVDVAVEETVSEDETPEEGTLFAATAEKTSEEDPSPVVSGPTFECTECEAELDEDQHDRCKIKGWPVICKTCAQKR